MPFRWFWNQIWWIDIWRPDPQPIKCKGISSLFGEASPHLWAYVILEHSLTASDKWPPMEFKGRQQTKQNSLLVLTKKNLNYFKVVFIRTFHSLVTKFRLDWLGCVFNQSLLKGFIKIDEFLGNWILIEKFCSLEFRFQQLSLVSEMYVPRK